MPAPRRRFAASFLVAALLAMAPANASAADLGRYRDWDKTAAAYYMTEEERAAWRTITTEQGAEAFVATYMARRGPEFEQELKRRIEIADRNFTAGRIRGSQTLRGRIIIVLGPPAKFDHVRPPESGRLENADLANIYTNVGPMGSQSVHYRVAPDVFTFTYTPRGSCKPAPCPPVVIRVELDPVRGTEQLPDKAAEKQLDRLLKDAIDTSARPPGGHGAKK